MLLWQTQVAITAELKICFSIMILIMSIIIVCTDKIIPTSVISLSDISESCNSPEVWQMCFCNRNKMVSFKY